MMYGKNHCKGGYTLVLTCSQPKNKSSKEPLRFDHFDIVVCPNCIEKIKEISDNKHGTLYCGSCDISYPIKKGIPFLLTHIPHHQREPPSSFIEDWEKYNNGKKES